MHFQKLYLPYTSASTPGSGLPLWRNRKSGFFQETEKLGHFGDCRQGSLKGSEVAQDTDSGKRGETHGYKIWDSVSLCPILLKVTDGAILCLSLSVSLFLCLSPELYFF